MARIYRKRKGTVLWHFCRNCSNWPTYDYEEHQEEESEPTTGVICSECKARAAAEQCLDF